MLRPLVGFVVCLLCTAAAAGGSSASPAKPDDNFATGARPSAANPPPLTHKPLRQNAEEAIGDPTEPERFEGYANAPAFDVVPRRAQIALFPCSQCHTAMPVNPTPRTLVSAPHNNALHHGAGRFWCLDCHMANDRDYLHMINGRKVDFNDSYLLCGQCHFNRQKDWFLGGHGKRALNWDGPRTLYNCTHCHNPHNPAIQPRKPSKPPPVRAGLQPMKLTPESSPKPWERASVPQGGQP